MNKILITGPESSGKSYLAKALAKHFNGRLINEYARTFLENKPEYQQQDLLTIAIGQFNSERAMYKKSGNYLFSDTGLEVIRIWSLEKYGNVDQKILDLEEQQNYDLILLCKPNIPWEYDELRENESDRDRLYEHYVSTLAHRNNVVEINENLEQRLGQAISYVEGLSS